MIKIGFSRSIKPLAIGSWTISEVEKRPYSHSFIIYNDPKTGREMIFQASHGQINIMSKEVFLEKNEIIKYYIVPIDCCKFNIFYNYIIDNLGKPYSYKQILWISLSKVLSIKRWPKCIYNIFMNGESEQICSEVALRAFDLIDESFCVGNIQIDMITPSDLDNILSKLKYEVKYAS